MPYLNQQQTGLLENGILDLLGDVDEEMFDYVRECMLELAIRENPPIQIDITSRGGAVNSGLLIYDLIRLYPGEKTGIVKGYASSMAAVILQACGQRQATANSLVMIHHIRRGEVLWDKVSDTGQLDKATWASMQSNQNKVYLILEERTKKSREVIAALCREEREMFAQEALEFGLIDEII